MVVVCFRSCSLCTFCKHFLKTYSAFDSFIRHKPVDHIITSFIYLAIPYAALFQSVPPNRSVWIIRQGANTREAPLQPTCQAARRILRLVVETRGKEEQTWRIEGFHSWSSSCIPPLSLTLFLSISLAVPNTHLHFLFFEPMWGCRTELFVSLMSWI